VTGFASIELLFLNVLIRQKILTKEEYFCIIIFENMILLDEPYVSDFLTDTIVKNRIKVLKTPFSEKYISDDQLLVSENEAVKLITEKKELLYTNSENAIGWISNNLNRTEIPGKIKLFKDKGRFRALISELFPDFYYKKVPFKELKNLSYNNLPKPFVIKPNVGFFSLGVHRIDTFEEWEKILSELEEEVKSVNDIYPLQVMDATDFIIESYIEGDEYAVDCYFDSHGNPVITNIMEHIFSSKDDVSDRLYYTSTGILKRLMKDVEVFLKKMNVLAKLRNFPLHIEIRVNNGRIIPIEGNPMRFGGWCTTADLAYHAYGFNPYLYYAEQKKPDWDKILQREDDAFYSLILLGNNTGFSAKEIKKFDYDKLLSGFSEPLELRKIDHHEFPLFGFLFVKTIQEHREELDKILVSDLKEYVVKQD
jgi:hypothetical protein